MNENVLLDQFQAVTNGLDSTVILLNMHQCAIKHHSLFHFIVYDHLHHIHYNYLSRTEHMQLFLCKSTKFSLKALSEARLKLYRIPKFQNA